MMAIELVDDVDRNTRHRNIEALAQLATQRIAAGDKGTLLTMMFNKLPGGPAAMLAQMRDVMDAFYRKMVTRVVRDPLRPSNAGSLPVLIGAIDRTNAVLGAMTARDLALNGGLHAHAIVLLPSGSRLGVPLEQHLQDNLALYLGDQRLARLHACAVRATPDAVLMYAFKAIRAGTVPYEQGVVILPRSISEIARR